MSVVAKAERWERRIIPPVYLLMAVLLMLALHVWLPIAQLIHGVWRVAGVLPILLGIAIAVSGRMQFHKHDTPAIPFETSTVLVTDGLFRYSRNPMYSGMIIFLTGLAICLGTISPIIIVPLFSWWITTKFIVVEEEFMSEIFGQSYLDYKAKVRRWI